MWLCAALFTCKLQSRFKVRFCGQLGKANFIFGFIFSSFFYLIKNRARVRVPGFKCCDRTRARTTQVGSERAFLPPLAINPFFDPISLFFCLLLYVQAYLNLLHLVWPRQGKMKYQLMALPNYIRGMRNVTLILAIWKIILIQFLMKE